MQRSSLIAAAIILVLPASAEAVPVDAERAPYERSCDGKPATFHVHRALVLIERAYRLERWEDRTPAKDRERRAWQAHKACARDAELRERIEDRRERRAERFGRYRELREVTPYEGPGGVWDRWAVPWYVIACESGGGWGVAGFGLGPYQFVGWSVPWPVNSWEDRLAHHRLADRLRRTYGLANQWACA